MGMNDLHFVLAEAPHEAVVGGLRNREPVPHARGTVFAIPLRGRIDSRQDAPEIQETRRINPAPRSTDRHNRRRRDTFRRRT